MIQQIRNSKRHSRRLVHLFALCYFGLQQYSLQGIKAFEVALLNRWLLLEKSEQNSCNLVASSLKMKNIDSRIYCRLGHYNLFMGYYSKGTFYIY